MGSVFLDFPESQWVASNALAFAIRDMFPVAKGHTLIVTRRVVRDWFEARREEQLAVLDLVDLVKRQLDEEFHPAGYNVGFNAGEAAGQTVMHLHVHVIPRYEGDMDDPRGGVRHAIPWKGNYKRVAAAPLVVGGAKDPFLAHIRPLIARAHEIAIVAAFVQDSGLELLQTPVFSAAERGARIRLVTGDYLDITQAEALKRMLDWQGAFSPRPLFEARVVETSLLPGPTRSFHPKSWRFEGHGFGVAFVGSSNVSASALATGIEWNLRTDRSQDPAAYGLIKGEFELLWDLSRPLTYDWVTAYAARVHLAPRAFPPGEMEAEPLTPAPEPHDVQREALDALATTRAEGERRALVVMATGLGKTLLAAYDADAFRGTLEHPIRILFVASLRARGPARVARDARPREGAGPGSPTRRDGVRARRARARGLALLRGRLLGRGGWCLGDPGRRLPNLEGVRLGPNGLAATRRGAARARSRRRGIRSRAVCRPAGRARRRAVPGHRPRGARWREDRRRPGRLQGANGIAFRHRMGPRGPGRRRALRRRARRAAREQVALSRGNAEGGDSLDRHGVGDPADVPVMNLPAVKLDHVLPLPHPFSEERRRSLHSIVIGRSPRWAAGSTGPR